MYYMNFDDKLLTKRKKPAGVWAQYQSYRKQHLDYTRLMESLFNDKSYVYRNIDADDFGYRLFKLASNLQSIEARKDMTLYDIFTKDELYANWQMENVRWYIEYGACPLNGGQQPFSQRNLCATSSLRQTVASQRARTAQRSVSVMRRWSCRSLACSDSTVMICR